MKGDYKFGLGLLIAVILLIALIQAAQKQPIDWDRTYDPKDKIPFGTYVIRHELKNIFKQNQSFTDINQSLYTYLRDTLKQEKSKKDLIYIGHWFHPGKTAVESILTFVHNGNNVFLACNTIPAILKDTLNLEVEYFNSYLSGLSVNKDSVYYELAAYGQTARFDKNSYPNFFSELNDSTTTILGYVKIQNLKLPNFIQIKFGKGVFYCQLAPDVYSNYFMLNADTYPIAYASLHHLAGKHILWYDGLFNTEKSRTPLRVILSRPALRAAWYLLLVTLLIYIIFKSKREQKAVPVVEPEKNMSVAFAETIGSLYYENGHPGNMVDKKVQYFLYYLKKKYRFENIAIENPRFRKQAAKRLRLTIDEINIFFDKLIHYQELAEPTPADLKTIQDLIEDFKQKIKLT